MFSSGSQSNVNIIQPIPRFYTIRFGRRKEIDDGDNNDNNREYRINEISRPSGISQNEIDDSPVLITDIRKRDWSFYDDPQMMIEKNLPDIKYQIIPSVNNTNRNRSMSFNIQNNTNQYEEYDLDEQDFQWLIAYNQFCIEKHLPELDENIFEYMMQLLEQQCLLAIRQKNYADTIQCDACHRVDDVDDLIQCAQCETIVHKKCYGLVGNENIWICLSCQNNFNQSVCCLCDKGGGALKLLKSSSDQEQVKWVHLSCAFWVPKIEFDEKMTPVLKDNLAYDGRCLICNKTSGVKLNCSWKNCQNQFHAICAVNMGRDMLVAENDERIFVRLLALCHRHGEKLDPSEKRLQKNKFEENKQKRFEQFESYINLDTIKSQTLILPDVLESIHAYWVLKRQANNCRPLIDIPDDIFYYGFDKNINLVEFSRQYHLEQHDQPTNSTEDNSNVLQFVTTNMTTAAASMNKNLFIKFAQRKRTHFIDYERNLFCLIDIDRKKREGFLERILSFKGSL